MTSALLTATFSFFHDCAPEGQNALVPDVSLHTDVTVTQAGNHGQTSPLTPNVS